MWKVARASLRGIGRSRRHYCEAVGIQLGARDLPLPRQAKPFRGSPLAGNGAGAGAGGPLPLFPAGAAWTP